MFDSIKIPYQTSLANQTFEWLGEDSPENFEKHCKQPNTRQKLENAGWFDKKITYQFNSHGYRGSEIDATGDYFMSVGCSFTFGTAIQTEQRYTDIVAEKIGLKSYNFGVQGGCDDTSFRLLLTWLDKLTPKFLIFQNTFPQRFEIVDDQQGIIYGINAALGGTVSKDHGEIYKQIQATEANEQIRARKNQLAVQHLCQEKGIYLIQVSYIDFLKTNDTSSRDLHHPGACANQSVAEIILNTL
jgi:hypothetical protein